MELPNPAEVRDDFSKVVNYLDSLVNLLSTKKSLEWGEFRDNFHFINMKIVRIWGQIDLLTVTDKKYSKAFEELRKILLKLLNDLRGIEEKHTGDNIFHWEVAYEKGDLRKDMVRFFNGVSKQMRRIQKNI